MINCPLLEGQSSIWDDDTEVSNRNLSLMAIYLFPEYSLSVSLRKISLVLYRFARRGGPGLPSLNLITAHKHGS